MGAQTGTFPSSVRLSVIPAAVLAAVPAAVSAGVMWWLITSGRWSLFGIWTLDSTTGHSTGFGDLAFITASADCFTAESAGVPVDMDTCDPYGRPFSPYGIIPGRFLSLFGLGFEQNSILGFALALIWVALAFGVAFQVVRSWNAARTELAVALTAITLFTVSPAAMLAVERGTLDILVAALAATGLLGFAGGGRVRHSVSTVLLFTSVTIKYFAVGVFVPFFAPRRWSIIASAGALATLVFLLMNLDNLRLAQEIAQADTQSTSRIMFSSTTGIITFLVEDPTAFFPPADQFLNSTAINVVGIVLFAAVTTALTLLLHRFVQPDTIPRTSWYLIVGGGFALAIPYFLGPSNDYRLVLLLIPLAGLLVWIGRGIEAPLRITLWVVVGAAVVAGLTGASMQPNEFGFILPKAIIIFGDAALATVLAFGVALFLQAWIPRKRVNT